MRKINRQRAIRPSLAAVLTASAAALALAGSGPASAHEPHGAHARAAATAGKSPVKLPANLAGFEDPLVAAKQDGASAKAVASQRADQAHIESATVAEYRRAYGDVPMAYRLYTNAIESVTPSVMAVRAPSPGLVIGPIQNPKYLGLAKPPRQVIQSGPVQCEVDWEVLGGKPPPSSEHVQDCQRTGDDLTVFAFAGTGFKGPRGLARVVALTNAAFTAAGG